MLGAVHSKLHPRIMMNGYSIGGESRIIGTMALRRTTNFIFFCCCSDGINLGQRQKEDVISLEMYRAQRSRQLPIWWTRNNKDKFADWLAYYVVFCSFEAWLRLLQTAWNREMHLDFDRLHPLNPFRLVAVREAKWKVTRARRSCFVHSRSYLNLTATRATTASDGLRSGRH